MSDSIRAQSKALSELRIIDEKVFHLHENIERMPKEVIKLEQALEQRKTELQLQREQFADAEKSFRRIEQELKEAEDHLRKAESKMMEVKTNEEYQAALKENEGLKAEKSALEDRALLFMNQVEEHRHKLKEAEASFNTFENNVLQDKTRLENERTKLLHQLEVQVNQRTQFTVALETDVLNLYERISHRMKALGISKAANGLCEGCHMRLRPQLFNEVIGFQAIHRCPSCGRLLVPHDVVESSS